jgi:hypothetical protein
MMTREEMAKVLGMVSALDGQKVDEAKLEMWFRVLGEYRLDFVEKCIVPAYRECQGIQLTAKELWQHVRREASQPVPRQWVKDLHDIGEHFECRPGEWGHPKEVQA